MRGRGQRIANLLVDSRTGCILHVSLTAALFCGYTPERLRKMNVADLFRLPVSNILRQLEGSGYLKIISLDAALSSGEACTIRAYASYAAGRPDGVFLSVFETEG